MSLEFEFGTDGEVRSIYKDETAGLVRNLSIELGSSPVVKRASAIEWESVGEKSGWTVRSESNFDLAIRRWDKAPLLSADTALQIWMFATREEALAMELKYFWDLLPKETP